MNRLLLSLLTLFFVLTSCNGQEKFPISKISTELENSGNPKIIVFMPSVSDSTEYASMIVQAFKNYFVEQLSFNQDERIPDNNVDILLVKGKNRLIYQGEAKETTQVILSGGLFEKQSLQVSLLDTTGMKIRVVDDELLSELNIPLFNDYNDSSVLLLLDKNNKIVWRDNDYRGQGEHLKPLEYKVKGLLGLSYPKPEKENEELKVGDQAPGITLSNGSRDVFVNFGSIQVLTFYPAAYSGVFDINNMARRISMERLAMMSCAMHITSFDRMQIENNLGVNYYAISESTPEILGNWKTVLGTHHIQYINDSDYSIALAFGAYNPEGYSNRMTVIIDKDGKIAYIDKDYKFDKEEEIQKVIKELQEKITN